MVQVCTQRSAAAVALVLALLLVGCRTAPNVKPYAEATGALYIVTSQAGVGLREEIAAAHDDSPESKQSADEIARDFKAIWDPYVTVMKSMSDYADGMVAVVDAANASRENARQVVDSTKGLLQSASLAFPGGDAALDAVKNAASALYERYANQKAAETVDEAIRQSEQPVREVSALLSAELVRRRDEITQLRQRALTDLAARSMRVQGNPVASINTLKERRRRAMEAFDAAAAQAEEATKASKDPASAVAARNAAGDEAARIDQMIQRETGREEFQAYRQQRAEIEARFDQLDVLLQKAATLTVAWAQSHRDLAAAATESRQPNYRLLLLLTTELLDTYSNYTSAKADAKGGTKRD